MLKKSNGVTRDFYEGPWWPCMQSSQLRTKGPGFEAYVTNHNHVCWWHLVDVKSVVVAMSSKFPSKLYFWGVSERGAIISVPDQNCYGMSPDHLLGWIPERRVDTSPLRSSNPPLNITEQLINEIFFIYTVLLPFLSSDCCSEVDTKSS